MIELKQHSPHFDLAMEVLCTLSNVPIPLLDLKNDFRLTTTHKITHAVRNLAGQGYPVEMGSDKGRCLRLIRPLNVHEETAAQDYWNCLYSK